jgi:hypothetical protein
MKIWSAIGKRTAAVLLVCLVVLGGIAVAVVDVAMAQNQPSCSNNSAGGLSSRSVSSGAGPQREVSLLTVAPNSVAVLCVTYHVDPSSLSILQPPQNTVNFSVVVDSVQANSTNSGKNAGTALGYLYSYTPAPGVTTTATPSSMSFNEGSASITVSVTYTITTSGNSNGYYGLSLTNLCSDTMIPLAITNTPQSVNESDFSSGFFYTGPSSCILEVPLSSAEIVGTGGFGISSIEVGNS